MDQPIEIPLRARKHARTKLALLQAAVERLERQPLEEVSVRDLCQAATVSEATFFNYFARKSDLLAYFVQLWVLELAWHGRRAAATEPGLVAIAVVFKRAAETVQRQPGLMGEVLAYQARLRERAVPSPPSVAERCLAYPDLEGIEAIADTTLDALLFPNLKHAVETGELPANTHVPSVMAALVAIFYGVPLTLRLFRPHGIASAYVYQLNLLWEGVRRSSAP